MATIKHISSKNGNYGAALDYLLFQHDENHNRPILDENGEKLLREAYRIDGIECTPETFEIECIKLNRECHKNSGRNEIKSHHYIVSFDPKDKTECGLTIDKAEKLGIEIAEKYFPGHQALICTHADGHNASGNIHVHIVINSLRKKDVDRQEYMDVRTDSLAGFKHRATDKFMEYLKTGIMKICRREGLHQVDLLTPAKERITDREYRKAMRGQKALDLKNGEIKNAGLLPKNVEFKTTKGRIRSAVRSSARQSHNETEFRLLLKNRYGIEVTESRGRWGYKSAELQRPIRARMLGSAYEKEAVLAALASVGRITDLTQVESKNKGYHYRKAIELSNIQRQAETIRFLQKNGFASEEELNAAINSAEEKKDSSYHLYLTHRDRRKALGRIIHYKGQWLSTRPVHLSMLHAKDPDAFRENNRKDILLYDAADQILKEEKQNTGKPVPSLKILKTEMDEVSRQQEAEYLEYTADKASCEELLTIRSNLRTMLSHGMSIPGQKASLQKDHISTRL